ncbi:MAG: hypothetical protein AB4050_18800 [Synechococcus sp.]
MSVFSMAFLAHVSLTMALSVAVAICASHRWGLLAISAPLSAVLWMILDGIWQPSYAFSVVEPSLLVVVLTVFALTGMTGQWRLVGGAIGIFEVCGVLATIYALQASADPNPLFHEAIRSGSPMVVGGLVATSVALGAQKLNWQPFPTLCAALAIGLTLDSSLYTAWVQEQALWQQFDWVQPLLMKLADKLLLASVAIATIWILGAAPSESVNQPVSQSTAERR